MRRTRLTPVGRLLAALLVLLTGAIAGAAGAAATRPHAQAWRCVSVRPGDTLWTIAARNPAPDRRETVHRIVEHNRLAGALGAGTSIWVPNEGDLADLAQADPDACPAVG